MKTTWSGWRFMHFAGDSVQVYRGLMHASVIATMHAIFLPVSLSAQHIDRIPASAIASATAQSSRSGSAGVVFSTSLDNNTQFILNRRTKASAVELHCEWDDIIVVKEGVGAMRASRKLRGLERYGAWEWRAKELLNAQVVPMRSGDIVRVAAGVAHEISATTDTALVYLVVKVRSSEPTPCATLPKRGQ